MATHLRSMGFYRSELGKILMTKFHMSRMSHLTEGKEIHFPPKSNATVINNPTEAQLPKMEMKI